MKRLLTIIPLVILLCFAFSCQQAEEVTEEEARVDMKKVADNIVQAYESVDVTAMINLYAEDAVIISPGMELRGRQAFKEHMESMLRSFPDFEIDIITVLPSGNHIVFEQVVRGTNTGPLSMPEGEIPPTGNKVEFKAVWIGRISPEGLIEEDRTYFDTGDFMRQLGLMK